MAELPKELIEFLGDLNKSTKESKAAFDETAAATTYLATALKKLQEQAKKTDEALADVNRTEKTEQKTKIQLDQETRKFVNTYIEENKRIRQQRKDGDYTAAESKRLLAQNEETFKQAMSSLGQSHRIYYQAVVPLTIGLDKFNKLINNEVVRSLGSFATSISSTAFSSKSGLEMSINVANTTFDTILKIAESASAAIPIVGEYAKNTLAAVGEGGKALLNLYGQMTQQIAGAFKAATSAGFVFADGLTGLRSAATNAGLTTDLFAKAMVEHRDSVQQFGGSLTAGAQRIGRVTQELGTKGVDRLQQFGFSLDEIPGLIAEVGARMRRSGTVTDAEVARQTQAYAQNLRVIAELTGQDAKTLQQKAEQNEKDLAFQQFLASKTPEEAEKIRQQMAVLPEASQELFKEMAQTGGQIFSQSGNILAQQAPAVAEMARRFFDTVNAGTVDATTGVQLLKDLGPTAAEEIKRNTKEFGTAAAVLGQEYGVVGEKLAATYKMLAPLSGKTIEEIIESSKKAGADDPDSKKLRETEREGMQQQVEIQKDVVAGLSTYLDIVKDLNIPARALVSGLDALKKKIDEITAKNPIDANAKKAAEAAKAGTTLDTKDKGFLGLGFSTADKAKSAIGQMTPDELSKFAQSQGVSVDDLAKAAGFKDANDLKQRQTTEANEKYFRQQQLEAGQPLLADGGIVRGPSGGFPATLHGAEAVIPLPDGIDGQSFAQMMRDVIAAGSDNNLNNNSQQGNQQVDLLATLIGKVDMLIDATRQVADHTERTSMRVA